MDVNNDRDRIQHEIDRDFAKSTELYDKLRDTDRSITDITERQTEHKSALGSTHRGKSFLNPFEKIATVTKLATMALSLASLRAKSANLNKQIDKLEAKLEANRTALEDLEPSNTREPLTKDQLLQMSDNDLKQLIRTGEELNKKHATQGFADGDEVTQITDGEFAQYILSQRHKG